MRWLDRVYVSLLPRTPCFDRGWGAPATLRAAIDGNWRELPPPSTADIVWRTARRDGAVRVQEGSFESADRRLPLECRTARVRLIRPASRRARGLVIAHASWSDDGLEARTRWFSPVVEHDLALLIPEAPFYGGRRRVGAPSARLAFVSDLVAMGRATIMETHALLRWATEAGYRELGICGYSMGGQMAALSGALYPDGPVRIVSIAPSASPASVFVDGPLQKDVPWSRLGPDARERMREVLGALSVLRIPAPPEPGLASLVGTRRDLIVPPRDARSIAAHWGVDIRWINDGHVSAVLLRPHALAQAVIDAFA